jgi:hypothetical protein
MIKPCPICGKETALTLGDYPREHFCQGHKPEDVVYVNPIIYTNPIIPKSEQDIIDLLGKIVELLKNIEYLVGRL